MYTTYNTNKYTRGSTILKRTLMAAYFCFLYLHDIAKIDNNKAHSLGKIFIHLINYIIL